MFACIRRNRITSLPRYFIAFHCTFVTSLFSLFCCQGGGRGVQKRSTPTDLYLHNNVIRRVRCGYFFYIFSLTKTYFFIFKIYFELLNLVVTLLRTYTCVVYTGLLLYLQTRSGIEDIMRNLVKIILRFTLGIHYTDEFETELKM